MLGIYGDKKFGWILKRGGASTGGFVTNNGTLSICTLPPVLIGYFENVHIKNPS